MQALAAILPVIAAFLWLLDRKDRRHAEQLTEILSVVASASPDLTAMQEMVAELCQRIQAPQLAAVTHAYGEQEYAPPAIPMDDDKAHWENKEALAERAMMQELAQAANGAA